MFILLHPPKLGLQCCTTVLHPVQRKQFCLFCQSFLYLEKSLTAVPPSVGRCTPFLCATSTPNHTLNSRHEEFSADDAWTGPLPKTSAHTPF